MPLNNKVSSPCMSSPSVDVVGSYLRPIRLLEARLKQQNNEISPADLQAIEDEEIKILVEKEVEAGLVVVSDGEFRRQRYMYILNILILLL
jgi:5-methyltetrahydropteroyltriglutamate--homocysteine methyltransferase